MRRDALQAFLALSTILVPPNSRTSSVPFFQASHTANGTDYPVASMPHLDLLSPARYTGHSSPSTGSTTPKRPARNGCAGPTRSPIAWQGCSASWPTRRPKRTAEAETKIAPDADGYHRMGSCGSNVAHQIQTTQVQTRTRFVIKYAANTPQKRTAH